VGGLTDTYNSLSYRVGEIERHLHSNERWASKLAVPAGGRVTEAAMTPFIAASGNNAYGVAVQIMDVNDAVGFIAGSAYYDAHRILVNDVDHATIYRFRLSWSTTTSADAIAAGNYATFMFRSAGATRYAPITVQTRRVLAAWKMWAEVWNATNLSEVDFFVGIHFYEN
jgi:hypothetical protein